jgi:thiol-disulfide isomerase/thioredoxin
VQTLLQAASATVVPLDLLSNTVKTRGRFATASPLRDNLSEIEDAMMSALAMTVLIFVSIDCPISNRYAPEITRLHQEFAGRGIRFRLVYPNPGDDDAAVRQHLKDFGYPAIGERDVDHTLVKMAGATITPEAAVFDAQQRLVYRGRIDDRHVELGRERPSATQHDLRNALTALLAGETVDNARTQAVGCFIADMKPAR